MYFNETAIQELRDTGQTLRRFPESPKEQFGITNRAHKTRGVLVEALDIVSVFWAGNPFYGDIRTRWEVGRRYTIQPRQNKRGIGRVQLLKITWDATPREWILNMFRIGQMEETL